MKARLSIAFPSSSIIHRARLPWSVPAAQHDPVPGLSSFIIAVTIFFITTPLLVWKSPRKRLHLRFPLSAIPIEHRMEDELARELRLATSDLLDLTGLDPTATFRTKAFPSLRPPLEAIPAPTFSPESKLEPIYSPTDVRPFDFALASHSPALGSNPSPGAAQDAQVRQAVSEEHDHLPSGGLSSRIGSVRGQPSQHIIITETVQQDTSSDLDSHGPRQTDSADDAGESVVRPTSRLRARANFDDIYLNEYGERVVNGKVVARMLGGRRRTQENEALPEREARLGPSSNQQAISVSSPGSQRLPSVHSTLVDGHDPNAVRTQTPPAFFLQSFPDALDPGRRTPLSKAFNASDELEAARSSIQPEHNGPGLQLKAPKPEARALNFGGSDDLDSDLDDDDDEAEMASATSDAAGSSEAAEHPSRHEPARSPQAAPVADARGLVDFTAPTMPPSLPDGSGRSSIASPSSTTSAVAATKGSSSKLEIPSISRRATPTIELSATQTEPVTLHGNRRQALRSERALSPADQGPSGANASDKRISMGARIESLFYKPLVPVTKDANEDEDPSYWSSSHNRSAGGSASVPSSPTFSAANASFRRGSKLSSLDEDGLLSESHHHGGHRDDEADRASLDSLPSSLLSLPVSTVTVSSHAASLASGGGSSLERRRSGNSYDGGEWRRRSGRGSDEASGKGERFAREVRIRGWKVVGSQARGWVIYEICIITKQGTTITIFRRFSSFVRLHQTLAQEEKDQAKWLPSLPSRRTGLLHKYDARYLETRRKSLQKWLEIIMLDRVWGASDSLQQWVLEGE